MFGIDWNHWKRTQVFFISTVNKSYLNGLFITFLTISLRVLINVEWIILSRKWIQFLKTINFKHHNRLFWRKNIFFSTRVLFVCTKWCIINGKGLSVIFYKTRFRHLINWKKNSHAKWNFSCREVTFKYQYDYFRPKNWSTNGKIDWSWKKNRRFNHWILHLDS